MGILSVTGVLTDFLKETPYRLGCSGRRGMVTLTSSLHCGLCAYNHTLDFSILYSLYHRIWYMKMFVVPVSVLLWLICIYVAYKWFIYIYLLQRNIHAYTPLMGNLFEDCYQLVLLQHNFKCFDVCVCASYLSIFIYPYIWVYLSVCTSLYNCICLTICSQFFKTA